MRRWSSTFTIDSLNAYDNIVELRDSEWLNEIEKINKRDFEFWKPKHYAIKLADDGMFQFIAREFTVKEYEGLLHFE